MGFWYARRRAGDTKYRAFDGVEIVVHAAALKQVPAAEYNPLEAVKEGKLITREGKLLPPGTHTSGMDQSPELRNSRRKSAYLYLLTPRGFREKARVTFVFLRQRVEEFEKLQSEIAELRKDSERV